jgi:hypothetical protein
MQFGVIGATNLLYVCPKLVCSKSDNTVISKNVSYQTVLTTLRGYERLMRVLCINQWLCSKSAVCLYAKQIESMSFLFVRAMILNFSLKR